MTLLPRFKKEERSRGEGERSQETTIVWGGKEGGQMSAVSHAGGFCHFFVSVDPPTLDSWSSHPIQEHCDIRSIIVLDKDLVRDTCRPIEMRLLECEE